MRALALLLFAIAANGRAAEVEPPAVLRACGDAGEYPPYTFPARSKGQPGSRVAGFNADFLQQLLAPSGRRVEITLLPWKRCLAMAQQGQFDFVLDVAATPARRAQFALSQPYGRLHSILMFDPRRPVSAPASRQDVDRLRRCEVLGWDTTRAGGSVPSDSQSYPSTMEMGFSMLAAGRCAAMISQLEVVRSLHLVGGESWVRGLQHHPLPQLPVSSLQYGVSRAPPYATRLLALLDAGIARMDQDGSLQRILANYVPPQPAVPRELRACGDAAGYAPYTYARRDGSGAAEGYNVDYLNAALARSGRKASVTLLPWKRCLLLASQGKYDLILDAADLPQRRRDFLLAPPHYQATPVLVYPQDRALPALANKAQLANVRRCVVAGWDFSISGTRERPELIVTAGNIQAAFAMLRHGRCSLLHYQLELLRALQQQGMQDVAGMQYRTVPWAPAAPMHYGIARSQPHAEALYDLLADAITQMAATEQPARLLARHLGK